MVDIDKYYGFWYYSEKKLREAVMGGSSNKIFYTTEEFRHILRCSR